MGFQAVKDLMVGVLMGVVSFLPGASGSTIAVIFRVYERLVADVADIRNKLIRDLRFIIPIGIGVLAGMVFCAKVLDELSKEYETQLMFLFVALIITQIPDIKKMGDDGKKLTAPDMIAFIAGIAVMVAFMVIGWNAPLDKDNSGFLVMVLIGVIYAMSLLSPGISGSTILLALGFYWVYTNVIGDFVHHLDQMLPIALGVLIGALVFSKIIDFCMRNYRKTTYMAILGLTVGSAVTVLINAVRSLSDYSTTELIIQCIACAVIGALLGLGLNKLAHIYADSSSEE